MNTIPVPRRLSIAAWATVLSMLCVVVPAAEAGEHNVRWRSDLKAARSLSKDSSKPMLLRFTASWCRYCRKMDETTFQDENVVKRLNECFVPVAVDADRNEELMKALNVRGLPTVVVISPKLRVVKTISGYCTAAVLDRDLQELCVKHANAERKDGKAVLGNAASGNNVEPAFGGYCLPTMLEERKLVAGSPELFTDIRGRRLLFASREMKHRFLSRPRKYLPADLGLCPVATRAKGKPVPGKPTAAAVYSGRLWFFATPEHRRRFVENPGRYVLDSGGTR